MHAATDCSGALLEAAFHRKLAKALRASQKTPQGIWAKPAAVRCRSGASPIKNLFTPQDAAILLLDDLGLIIEP